MSKDKGQDAEVQRVLAEAESIRAGGTAGAASPQAGAAHDGTEEGQPSSASTPAWEQYRTEAGLCVMYGDVLLKSFGCDPLGPDEQAQAAQAWAELLAKWFPSVKAFMGPEMRLLTIYGIPVAGRLIAQWTIAPSPPSSAGEEAARPPS